MSRYKGLPELVTSVFLLSGAVSLSAFLILGITYAIGATHQVIVLFASIIAGSYVFSVLGLLTAKVNKIPGIVPVIVSIVILVLIFLLLRISMVMSLNVLIIYSFLSMSVDMPVNHFVSSVSKRVRGSYISPGHFISTGSGPPVVFAVSFLLYAFMGYSNLPLITLVYDVSAFSASIILVNHALLHSEVKGARSHA